MFTLEIESTSRNAVSPSCALMVDILDALYIIHLGGSSALWTLRGHACF